MNIEIGDRVTYIINNDRYTKNNHKEIIKTEEDIDCLKEGIEKGIFVLIKIERPKFETIAEMEN